MHAPLPETREKIARARPLPPTDLYCGACGRLILWGRVWGYCHPFCAMTREGRWRSDQRPEVGAWRCPDHGLVRVAGLPPGRPHLPCPVPRPDDPLQARTRCGRFCVAV